MSKIARRQFIQLSAVAAAGYLARPGAPVHAEDLVKLTEDDPQAKALHYTADASTVDAATRPRQEPVQHCGNCAMLTGEEGDQWRPCKIFPGKLVHVDGWCSVWTPAGNAAPPGGMA